MSESGANVRDVIVAGRTVVCGRQVVNLDEAAGGLLADNPGLIERWSEKIEGRQKFSLLVAGMYSEFGALNKWVHIWAYKDANERTSVRAAASATGQWPARNPPGVVVKQENAFVMPASFSPIR